jgi:hypothetical protein
MVLRREEGEAAVPVAVATAASGGGGNLSAKEEEEDEAEVRLLPLFIIISMEREEGAGCRLLEVRVVVKRPAPRRRADEGSLRNMVALCGLCVIVCVNVCCICC